jgi:hypothetical protein
MGIVMSLVTTVRRDPRRTRAQVAERRNHVDDLPEVAVELVEEGWTPGEVVVGRAAGVVAASRLLMLVALSCCCRR